MRMLLVAGIAATAFYGAPAFAADMPLKAPPPPPAPVYSWTGFYGGLEFGAAWSDHAVTWAPNDPLAGLQFNGIGQPLVSSYNLARSGPVGGFELGYNWQVASQWLFGIEADFSGSSIDGKTAGPTSLLTPVPVLNLQNTTTQQNTDWYGTVRGRLGWLAMPNLLVFGTGGLAYGHTHESASYDLTAGGVGMGAPFSFSCTASAHCFAGSSSTSRTGWTAGGGIEWMLDQHWTAKVEYQLVQLESDSIPVVATAVVAGAPIPSSMTASLRDQFSVVRLGLNYRM
jgi:outer membrane immunogenic protein